MSQEDRRRLAARARFHPLPWSEEGLPAPLRFRRYSEGLERGGLHTISIGRFSRGAERLPEDDPSKAHIGRFSDGVETAVHGPQIELHVGRFSQGADDWAC
jgi:hypothetical protein